MANTTGFKARVEYEVTDGTQTTYTFPFSYLRKKFVMVSILHSDASETALEYGVDYTVNDLSVSLTTPAQVGEHIIIYRQTSTDKIVTWNDGSILLARDMNTEDAQMLHLQEEQQDYIMAHAISTKVTSDKEVLWDALNHRVINVSDPKDPQDAVTKHYMESVQGGFVAANTILVQEATKQASAAKSSQEAAKTSETNAKTSETNSEISHQKAKKWAEATDSPDGEVDTDSTTGKTQSSKEWALYSKTKAQEAATSATNAKSSETNAKTSETNSEISHQKAKKWAEATDSPDGEVDTDSTTGKTQSSKEWALYSKTKAQEAATSATNAKSSETNAKTSETNAKTSETKAAVSEANAKTSETNAKSSETKSKDSENAARVSEQNAAESARVATENAMDFNMLKRNKAYSIGDIAYSSYLPSWARLECVTAGATADTVPFFLPMVSRGGLLISDGTVTWIVDDVRDMTPVGCVRGSLFLPKGYIKANGATVQRADYPRLVHFIEANNLWTNDTTTNAGLFGKGDGSNTFVLPDYRERMMQYTEGSIGAKRNAGVPNITGGFYIYAWAAPIDMGNNAFTITDHPFKKPRYDNTNERCRNVHLDASSSNPIYGSSNTVQPPAINVIPILRY